MAMQSITIEIQGITPLLLNKFTDEAQQKATSGNTVSFTGDRGTPREQAESKLYLDNDGKTYVMPAPNLFRCLIDAGKFFKAGKSKVTTIKSSLIPACVDLHGIAIPIKSKEGWDVDTRPVRIPSTGGRILCHRPVFNDWTMKFEVTLDTSLIGIKLFREIVDAAGRRIGLGDFRPDCKGPFGKFVVTSWKAQEVALAA